MDAYDHLNDEWHPVVVRHRQNPLDRQHDVHFGDRHIGVITRLGKHDWWATCTAPFAGPATLVRGFGSRWRAVEWLLDESGISCRNAAEPGPCCHRIARAVMVHPSSAQVGIMLSLWKDHGIDKDVAQAAAADIMTLLGASEPEDKD